MSGIVNSTGAKSGVIGTTVGTAAAGITEADSWRISSGLTVSSNQAITANWERSDSVSDKIGTGMTDPATGVFAFPSTGIWFVEVFSHVTSGTSGDYVGIGIHATTDNSSYSYAAESYGNAENSGEHSSFTCFTTINVTSTSLVKVRLNLNMAGGSSSLNYQGSSTSNKTSVFFLRLGDVN